MKIKYLIIIFLAAMGILQTVAKAADQPEPYDDDTMDKSRWERIYRERLALWQTFQGAGDLVNQYKDQCQEIEKDPATFLDSNGILSDLKSSEDLLNASADPQYCRVNGPIERRLMDQDIALLKKKALLQNEFNRVIEEIKKRQLPQSSEEDSYLDPQVLPDEFSQPDDYPGPVSETAGSGRIAYTDSGIDSPADFSNDLEEFGNNDANRYPGDDEVYGSKGSIAYA